MLAIERERDRGDARRKPPPPRAALRLERRPDGQLWARTAARECPVRVTRCFPWSQPTRFISLRDYDDEEVELVRDLSALDDGSRAALARALAEAGFVLFVERIESVEEEVEIRCWRVRTSQGPRTFQTLRDEWPREMPGGGMLVHDVAGDLFYIPDVSALDAASRRRLWAFLD